MDRASAGVVEAMDEISAIATANNEASAAMTGGAGSVAGCVDSMAAISEENSAAAEEVSAATQQMSAQADEVARSAASISRMAAELDELVARFRIDDGATAGGATAGTKAGVRPANVGLPGHRAA